ncbi:MAG: hypothetical protein L6Q98_25240 [Anaerolineae bacterium]|nr:hypothetical protein [Anaerolineae bacterium]NUQ05939.1 hypothetical protein [Anaerolineae bacterium]
MNYSQHVSQPNIIIHTYSPRATGETEARSEWKEVKNIPSSFAERVALLDKLATIHKQVWLKTAEVWGRARVFVLK